jgi:hypothetical protein
LVQEAQVPALMLPMEIPEATQHLMGKPPLVEVMEVVFTQRMEGRVVMAAAPETVQV